MRATASSLFAEFVTGQQGCLGSDELNSLIAEVLYKFSWELASLSDTKADVQQVRQCFPITGEATLNHVLQITDNIARAHLLYIVDVMEGCARICQWRVRTRKRFDAMPPTALGTAVDEEHVWALGVSIFQDFKVCGRTMCAAAVHTNVHKMVHALKQGPGGHPSPITWEAFIAYFQNQADKRKELHEKFELIRTGSASDGDCDGDGHSCIAPAEMRLLGEFDSSTSAELKVSTVGAPWQFHCADS